MSNPVTAATMGANALNRHHSSPQDVDTTTSNRTPSDEREEIMDNTTELVRNIASYLSLSEVESIGSLYSMVSASTAATSRGGGLQPSSSRGTIIGHSSTLSMMSMSSSSSNLHHHQTVVGGGAGTGTGAGGGVHHSNNHYFQHLNSHHHYPSGTFVPMMEDVHEKEFMDMVATNKSSTTVVHDGTAGTGVGISPSQQQQQHTNNNNGTTSTTINNHDLKNAKTGTVGKEPPMDETIPKKNVGDTDRNKNSKKKNPFNWATQTTTSSTTTPTRRNNSPLTLTPGLIALSPMPLDDDDDDDDDEDSNDESKKEAKHTTQPQNEESKRIQTQVQKQHFQKLQQKLQQAVLSHPQSIRSYCQSSQRAAIQMKLERRREIGRERRRCQIFTMMQETAAAAAAMNAASNNSTSITTVSLDPASLWECPNCHEPVDRVSKNGKRRKRRLSEDSSAVLSVDGDYDTDTDDVNSNNNNDKNNNNTIEDEERNPATEERQQPPEMYNVDQGTDLNLDSYLANCSCYLHQNTPDQDYDYNYQSLIYLQHNQSQLSSSSPPPLHQYILQLLTDPIFRNVPLSILFDLSISTMNISSRTIYASVTININCISSIIQCLIHTIHNIWSHLTTTLNPQSLLDLIAQIYSKTMGRFTSAEAIVTGIQSVATGVGSAGNAAIHAFSRNGGHYSVGGNHNTSVGVGSNNSKGKIGIGNSNGGAGVGVKSSTSSSTSGGNHQFGGGSRLVGSLNKMNILGGSMRENIINEKMFRKMNKIDSAAKVISYVELHDEVITEYAKKRVQRMMHYPVSLRPFVATIEVPPPPPGDSFNNVDFPNANYRRQQQQHPIQEGMVSSSTLDTSNVSEPEDTGSPFMCTPKSFPPTPSSRAHVLARGTRFAEDVVFLARDQLRVEEALDSKNDKTRAMAKALREGSRLAIFNASDVSGGITLTCGQHCASKVGNDLYCSARGMIPVLRNCWVYFEMSVSTPPLLSMMLHHASLSIGLSTLEMPLNALVGAWKGSAGLCSTGQILAGSQWCSPLAPKTYGSSSTVGCLVYLDDESAFETWDGVMVTANIIFNVNGHIVIPAGVLGSGVVNPSSSAQSLHTATNNTSMDEDTMSTGGNTVTSQSSQDPNSALKLFVPREEELFPTLTLHSSQTEVLSRFCSEDILAKSQEEIGAPHGATIYAVDGSVLFDGEGIYMMPTGADNSVIGCPSLESLSDVDLQR